MMPDTMTAGASQVAAVAQTLRASGGTYPPEILNPRSTPPGAEYKLSQQLADVINRENSAVEPPSLASIAKGMEILGLDHAAVVARVSKLFLDSRVKDIDVNKLSASTLAHVHTIAAGADRLAALKKAAGS